MALVYWGAVVLAPLPSRACGSGECVVRSFSLAGYEIEN